MARPSSKYPQPFFDRPHHYVDETLIATAPKRPEGDGFLTQIRCSSATRQPALTREGAGRNFGGNRSLARLCDTELWLSPRTDLPLDPAFSKHDGDRPLARSLRSKSRRMARDPGPYRYSVNL